MVKLVILLLKLPFLIRRDLTLIFQLQTWQQIPLLSDFNSVLPLNLFDVVFVLLKMVFVPLGLVNEVQQAVGLGG